MELCPSRHIKGGVGGLSVSGWWTGAVGLLVFHPKAQDGVQKNAVLRVRMAYPDCQGVPSILRFRMEYPVCQDDPSIRRFRIAHPECQDEVVG
eukprot:9242502-Alexandrium_andersonii.AAC.1